MNPTNTATTQTVTDDFQVADQAPKSFHTFITSGPRGTTEYAILPTGTIKRLTPKPLNKKQRRKMFKQSNAVKA